MATVLPPSPSFTDGSHLFFVVFRKMVSFVSDCGHKKLLAWQYTVVIFDMKIERVSCTLLHNKLNDLRIQKSCGS